MTNFKLSLRTSATLILALAFCCLIIGQVAVADGQGLSTKYNPQAYKTPAPTYEKVSTRVFSELAPVSDKNAIPARPNPISGDKQGGETIATATVIPATTTFPRVR